MSAIKLTRDQSVLYVSHPFWMWALNCVRRCGWIPAMNIDGPHIQILFAYGLAVGPQPFCRTESKKFVGYLRLFLRLRGVLLPRPAHEFILKLMDFCEPGPFVILHEQHSAPSFYGKLASKGALATANWVGGRKPKLMSTRRNRLLSIIASGRRFSQREMAILLGVCDRTLRNDLQLLARLGYIEVKRVGCNQPNVYRLQSCASSYVEQDS